MRTADEIVARVNQHMTNGSDPFGWCREVLLAHLDAEHVAPLVKPEADLSGWTATPLDDTTLLTELADYLDFAWGKALDHRGLSAGRSVDKLGEWLWLLGNDEAFDRFTNADYAPYGAPQLAEVSRLLERPIPDGEEARRMADGLPCRPECWDGCSSW